MKINPSWGTGGGCTDDGQTDRWIDSRFPLHLTSPEQTQEGVRKVGTAFQYSSLSLILSMKLEAAFMLPQAKTACLTLLRPELTCQVNED